MIVRLVAILFAMLLSARAVLPDGAVWVCRYTGQRVEPCVCPETRPPDDAHLLPRGCCELHQGQHSDVPGVLPVLDSRLPVLALAVPLAAPLPSPEPSEEPGTRVRAGHDPPPRERLFLSLRQWLL